MKNRILPDLLEFNRPAKPKSIGVIGSGACGETIRIRDEAMECDFVAKKYRPIVSKENDPVYFEELQNRFREEAKILFSLNHPNVVRVFNYYDYREQDTAYIIMEFIEGTEILEFIRNNPNTVNSVFEKVIDGFLHLEERDILHRDIRSMNVLVSEDGSPKIIDFGFGKQLGISRDKKNKSISLNWWCETPPEFDSDTYDFQTEVYFVGKLFEKAIIENDLSDFKYKSIVRKMCILDRESRTVSFMNVQNDILEGKFDEIDFTSKEIECYRVFSSGLSELISEVDTNASYQRDRVTIIAKLDAFYMQTMLEDTIVAPHHLARIFIDGGFRYWKNTEFKVQTLKDFLDLLKGLSTEKCSVVLQNLITRLDAVEKIKPNIDDEIPF